MPQKQGDYFLPAVVMIETGKIKFDIWSLIPNFPGRGMQKLLLTATSFERVCVGGNVCGDGWCCPVKTHGSVQVISFIALSPDELMCMRRQVSKRCGIQPKWKNKGQTLLCRTSVHLTFSAGNYLNKLLLKFATVIHSFNEDFTSFVNIMQLYYDWPGKLFIKRAKEKFA